MQWKKRKIKELGKEGFEKLNRETLNRGTSFHSLVHRFLEDGETPDEEFASPQVMDWMFSFILFFLTTFHNPYYAPFPHFHPC